MQGNVSTLLVDIMLTLTQEQILKSMSGTLLFDLINILILIDSV